MQRRFRSKRLSKNLKKKFLPALGIFNKQRNSKPVFKSGSARRVRHQQSRRDESSSEEEEEEDEAAEEDEEDETDFDSDASDDEAELPAQCTTSERRKRRASHGRRGQAKSAKKPRANPRALREVSSNRARRVKHGAGGKSKAEASKLKKRASLAASRGNKRAIGGLEIRANRDSLKIERHNNLAYFNRIQDELRGLVQQRDEEAAAEAEEQTAASSPSGSEIMQGDAESDGEEYDEGAAECYEHESEDEEEGDLVDMTPAVDADGVAETPIIFHKPRSSSQSARGRHAARSPSIESAYSHHSAASFGHSRSSRPSSRPSRSRRPPLPTPIPSFLRDHDVDRSAVDSRDSHAISTSSSGFRFDSELADFTHRSSSREPTAASPFATPDSPPPSPFVDPAASALGLHDPDDVPDISTSSRSPSSRVSHPHSSRHQVHADFPFSSSSSSSRARDYSMPRHGEFSSSSTHAMLDDTIDDEEMETVERGENDDLFALPNVDDSVLQSHGRRRSDLSRSRSKGRGDGHSAARQFRDYDVDDGVLDVSTPTPPLLNKSRARTHSPRQSRSGSSTEFSFLAGASSQFRVRPRHGF